MRYKCIKGLILERYDDNGFAAEGICEIEVGSIWEMKHHNIIGGEVHLDSCEDDRWIEVSKETFSECFVQEVTNELD